MKSPTYCVINKLESTDKDNPAIWFCTDIKERAYTCKKKGGKELDVVECMGEKCPHRHSNVAPYPIPPNYHCARFKRFGTEKEIVHYAIKEYLPLSLDCYPFEPAPTIKAPDCYVTSCMNDRNLAEVYHREFYKNKGEIIKCFNGKCPYTDDEKRHENFRCTAYEGNESPYKSLASEMEDCEEEIEGYEEEIEESKTDNNMSKQTGYGQVKSPKTVVLVSNPPRNLCSVEEIKEWATGNPPRLRAFYLYDDEHFYDVIQVGDRYRDPVDEYDYFIVDINNEIIDNHSEWEEYWDRDFFVDYPLLRDRPFDKGSTPTKEIVEIPQKQLDAPVAEAEEIEIKQTDSNLKFLKMETKKEKQENGIVRKMKDLYMPKRIDDARLTLNGVFCVERNGEWVGIDNNGVTTYPSMYTFPIPMLTINKSVKELCVGEIIAVKESYGRVTEIKNKIVKYVGFDGGNHSLNVATDFVFKVGFVRTVLAPKFDGTSGDANKNMGVMMAMTMMGNAEDDVLLPMLMTWNQSGLQMNPMAMVPMMLLMKGKEEVSDNKKSDTAMAMAIAMMMGQQNGNMQNPFGNTQNPMMMLPMTMAMKDGSNDKSAMAMMAMMMGQQNGNNQSLFGNMQNPSMMLPMMMAMEDGIDGKSVMAMMVMMMGMGATQNGKEEKA